jgi:hypothetical protein
MTRRAPISRSPIEYLDRPPPGWFALEVMRTKARKWDWVALVVDVHPDDLQNNYDRGGKIRECWVRIPGRHRSRDAAWEAFEDMATTRH